MYDVSDWLAYHKLDIEKIEILLCARDWHTDTRVSFNLPSYADKHLNIKSCNEELSLSCRTAAFQAFIVPAFTWAFSSSDLVCQCLETLSFEAAPDDTDCLAHCRDNGKGQSPTIIMCWNGDALDLLLLAHETAHALQIVLSDHALMPPVARETCAFLGELYLIKYLEQVNHNLAAKLISVWCEDNDVYLGQDRMALLNALHQSDAPYQYAINYPLARICAISLALQEPDTWLIDLFSSGTDAMAFLPLSQMANAASEPKNNLPPLPHPKHSSVDAYRCLGAAVLLDLESWDGEAQKSIETYYALKLRHLTDKSLFLCLQENRQPLGYAQWERNGEGGGVTIKFGSAPFGGSKQLHAGLRHHIAHLDDANQRQGSQFGGQDNRQVDWYAATGYALELLANSHYHRQYKVGPYFEVEILPALTLGQTRFYLSKDGIPTGLATWAWITRQVESELHETGRALSEEEWACGDHLFFNDWLTPYGNIREIYRDMFETVFPQIEEATSLRRNMDGSVRRINRWHAKARADRARKVAQ